MQVWDKLGAAEESSGDEQPAAKRRCTAIQTKVVENFHQTELVLFKGVDMPFTEAQKAAIERQCARATFSAGLAFR